MIEESPEQCDNYEIVLAMQFQGYLEAYFFLIRWLGNFTILSTENFKEKFIKDIKDSISKL
ncbi:MAG: hypothetical protein ACLFR1_13505 [Spirochaetia bacterium]